MCSGLYTLIFILLELFLVAPLRIEPSLEAYETSVQTTAVAMIGGVCQNRTDYFRAMDLQSIPLPAGPHTIVWHRCEESNSLRRVLEARGSTSYLYATPIYLVAPRGFEPRSSDSKSDILPLDDGAVSC